jgi:hypothetical protein
MSEANCKIKFETVPLSEIDTVIRMEEESRRSAIRFAPRQKHVPPDRLLLVDFDPQLGGLRTQVLRKARFDLTLAADLKSAVRVMKTLSPEILLICYSVPELHCETLIDLCRQHSPSTSIALLTRRYDEYSCSQKADSVISSNDPTEMIATLKAQAASSIRALVRQASVTMARRQKVVSNFSRPNVRRPRCESSERP